MRGNEAKGGGALQRQPLATLSGWRETTYSKHTQGAKAFQGGRVLVPDLEPTMALPLSVSKAQQNIVRPGANCALRSGLVECDHEQSQLSGHHIRRS